MADRFNWHVRTRWWSLRNWMRGYQWSPVQRFRCCDHTTPFHYGSCKEADRG